MKDTPHTKAELEKILLRVLPPIVPRHKCQTHLGDLFSGPYLANLDSAGLGPRSVKFGRKVAYLREDLVAWLLDRMDDEKGGKSNE